MWTVAHKKCWTADRLARKGLCHPAACPLFVIKQMKQLTTCWSLVLSADKFGLLCYMTLACRYLHHKLGESSSRIGGQVQKGVNSIITLGSWSLWNHHNCCVFDGITPNSSSVIRVIKEEMQQWSFAGARGVSHLLAIAPTAT